MFGFPEFYDRPSRGYGFPSRRQVPRQTVSPFFSQPQPRYQQPVYRQPAGYPYYQQEPQYIQPQYEQQQEMDEDDNDIFNLFGHRRPQVPRQQRPQQQYQQQAELQDPRTHHFQQQAQQPQPQIKRQPRKINRNKPALKIQRLWRGWNVRKHDMIAKLRAIKKLDEEVDKLSADNQEFLHPSSTTEVPADVQVTNNVPRPLLLFEHELTAKLLATDEISGRHDIIRSNRKELVNKIERILEQVDSAKTFFQQNHELTYRPPAESHPQQDPVAEPLLSSEDDEDLEEDATDDHTTNSDNVEPIIEDLSDLQLDSSKNTSDTATTNEILPLKTMCYNVCDRVMKQAM